MNNDRLRVPALKVRQWLSDWNEIPFDTSQHRAEPQHWFYIFSLNAGQLRALSGISRRTTRQVRRSDELGIQREHDPTRSAEIGRFVRHGYPWSTMTQRQRESGRFNDLKKPGWLPTALVVNILKPGDRRHGEVLAQDNAIAIEESAASPPEIVLPKMDTAQRHGVRPIEVIDGQHRLWAFEEDLDESFELPVVAYVGLDISWQAYLFWTINIKPKKINASLAFDLYPLLRTEDWLTRFEGPRIYRETRAQEITETLWAYPQSPWYQRINMLGSRGGPKTVSQSSWIRSLIDSFLRPFTPGRGRATGGLFGAPVEGGSDEPGDVLPWNRSQQAALIVRLWQELEQEIKSVEEEWAIALRKNAEETEDETWGRDPALASRHSLLAGDQGVRALLGVANDLIYSEAESLDLWTWAPADATSADDHAVLEANIESLSSHDLGDFIQRMSRVLATYDWRTSAAPAQNESKRLLKASFRGTGGYRIFRRELLRHIGRGDDEQLKLAANQLRLSEKEPD